MRAIAKMTLCKVFPACDFMELDEFRILNNRGVFHMIHDTSLVEEVLQLACVELIVIRHHGFNLLFYRRFGRTDGCVEALKIYSSGVSCSHKARFSRVFGRGVVSRAR